MTMILMRSPKGGVGTTFLTARLAIALAARGYEVSAIDATTQDSLKLFFELSPSQSLEMFDAALTPDAISGVQLFRADPELEDFIGPRHTVPSPRIVPGNCTATSGTERKAPREALMLI